MSGDLNDLVGRRYGPFHLRTSVEKVEEFVTATGGEPDRWEFHAPPGFAAVALFKSAPAFFADEDAAEYAKTLVHVDQTFRWHRPLPQEIDTRVTGEVESVRHRGEMFFVTFTIRTEGDDGTLFFEAVFDVSHDRGRPPQGEGHGGVRAAPGTNGAKMRSPDRSASRRWGSRCHRF